MGKTSKAEMLKRKAEVQRLTASGIFNPLLLDELQGYAAFDYDADKMREARNKLHHLLDKKLSDCKEQADDL